MSDAWRRFGTIDDASLRHVVDTVRRWENYEGVDVVSVHRSPGNVKPDEVWRTADGIPHGRVTTVVAATNATGMNEAIARGFKESRQGETDIRLQRGITRIATTPILMQNMAGFSIIGGGANLGQGNDPDGTSWYADTTGSQFYYGTEIYGTGYGAAAMVELTDVTCLRWKGVSLRGDGSDFSRYGILVAKATGGLGPSTLFFEQVSIQNCDEGINIGRVASDAGGYVATNGSEVVMVQPMLKNCTYGYTTMHGQNVNHVLIQPQYTEGTALWKQTGGGGMTMIQPVTYDSGAIIESTGGGSNTGATVVIGARPDTSGTVNTKLLNSLDDNFNVFLFLGGGAVYNAGVSNGARATVQPNNFVTISHWHNLSDAGGSKPVFESAATGAKIVTLDHVWLIPESYRSFSRSDNIGTWHSNGDWAVRDCIDNTNYIRVRDAEFPRINGRSSTHAYEREFDFEQIGDGLAGIAASVVGTGTVTAVVPWDVYTVGVVALDTGSGATDAAAVITHTGMLAFTGGPWRLEIRARLLQLSVGAGGVPDPTPGVTTPYGGTSGIAGGDVTTNDADEFFTVRIGFLDAASGEPTDGAYWRYSAANSGRWECVTRDGGAETAVDAGVLLTNAVAAGDQDAHVFEVKVNPAGTSISFYLDGELAATTTTNLPDATDYMGYGMTMTKTAGTSNRYSHIDFLRVEFVPSTARGTTHNK